MISYLKLVHFELTRFRWIYISLFVLTLLSQAGGLYLYANNMTKRINERMIAETLTEAQYVLAYGKTGFVMFTSSTMWFNGPIVLCITALLIYVFLIWYRDWIGKNMFIYRLFMLPTSRSKIYLAKVSVILSMVWGLIAFQMLLLPSLNRLYNSMIPSMFRYSMSIFDIISTHPIMQILIPKSFIEFVLYYGAGIIGVSVIFTVILMERSYRWKGLFGGIVYGAAVGIILFQLLIFLRRSTYFYPLEIALLGSGAGLLILCISLWISFFLLNKKASV